MLIKKLIQRLLDSRTTPEEAGHSAMPSSSYVTVTATAVQAWGEMAKGVATFDGFVRVSARATSSNANVRVTNDTAAMFSQIEATASGQTQGVFVPVAKGDSWSVFGTNRDNPVVRVVKAIGGGYNYLARRALSCLKPSFNYLQRSSCKASILTLLTSVGLVHILRRNTSQAMKEKILWLRSAAGRSLNLVPLLTTLGLGLRTLPGDPATLLTQSATVSGRPSQCKKETRSVSILGPTTQTRLPSYLFATNRLNNLLSTGGALC